MVGAISEPENFRFSSYGPRPLFFPRDVTEFSKTYFLTIFNTIDIPTYVFWHEKSIAAIALSLTCNPSSQSLTQSPKKSYIIKFWDIGHALFLFLRKKGHTELNMNNQCNRFSSPSVFEFWVTSGHTFGHNISISGLLLAYTSGLHLAYIWPTSGLVRPMGGLV